MPLLINGIDTPSRTLPTLTNVRFRGGLTNVRCEPYGRPVAGTPVPANHGGETVEGQKIRRVREAIYHIMHRISHHQPANRAFASLPRGQTLSVFLATTNIFICQDPSNNDVLAASPVMLRSPSSATDIRLSITRLGFAGSGRSVEATMLHELAHICGATHTHTRGGQFGAEEILRASRMGDQFSG